MRWRRNESGGARTRFGTGRALGVELAVQRVDGCVQNQVAIRASGQMVLYLVFDVRGESTLEVPANQMDGVFTAHIPRPSCAPLHRCNLTLRLHFQRQTASGQ